MENLKRLEELTTLIDEHITSPVNHADGEALGLKIVTLSGLLGRSAEAVALADMVYNECLGALCDQFKDSKLSATDKKMIFAGRLKKEIYYTTLTERQNKALTHAIEGLRAVIGFLVSSS
jgi:hypothetical protein